MSTELVFFASVSDYGKLVEKLNVLKRSGIGKKHDMGFGDLISREAYRIKFDEDGMKVLDPMILRVKEHNNLKTVITLHGLPAAIINKLRQENKLLVVNMKVVLSRTKPSYWVREGALSHAIL